MAETIEYGNVLQEIRGAMNPGRLRLQSNAIIFKNNKTGKFEQFPADQVESAKWLIRARGYCLKIMEKSGEIHRFDGLQDQEFEKLSTYFKSCCSTGLEKVDIALKGWNWGSTKFVGNAMNFNIGEKFAFEVPLNNVSHTVAQKSEVTVEFHPNDDAALSLMELRFHIPTNPDTPDADPVAEFYDNVMAKADIIQATGDAIAIFSEVQCLTPRGRYDIKLYPSFLQLHGKTFDYKIPYTTILRLFLLPHKDHRQMFFIVSLDPPIKQGQTRYPFLILLFDKDDETTLELGISEEMIEEKYDGKLMKEMAGLEYEIVSRIMKALVNRKITVPGNFQGTSGSPAISCSYKAALGFLYPLERGFFFVHKPPVHIRFEEISNVHFSRSAGSTRSFDFEIETRLGVMFTFSSIIKDEYGKLYDFITQKKLRVKNIGDKVAMSLDDGEMSDSGDEDKHDHYLARMKREGKGKVLDLGGNDLGSTDDSSDESFRLPDGSDSDVELEWDSDAPETSSDDGELSLDSDDSNYEEKRKQRRREKEKRREVKRKKAKSVPESSGTKRKRRTKKAHVDPNMPKRPLSGYFRWLNDNREKIKSENPGISITEVSKKAGELWRNIDSPSKKKKVPTATLR